MPAKRPRNATVTVYVVSDASGVVAFGESRGEMVESAKLWAKAEPQDNPVRLSKFTLDPQATRPIRTFVVKVSQRKRKKPARGKRKG